MAALDLFDISGKRAVVTGGASGIGMMIARGYVQAGASVVIASRKEESLKEVADELGERGECSYVVADLSKEDGCRALGEAVAVAATGCSRRTPDRSCARARRP